MVMSETVWIFEIVDQVGCGEGGWIAVFKEKPNLTKLKACFPLYEGQDESEFPSDNTLQGVISDGVAGDGWSVGWFLTEEGLK